MINVNKFQCIAERDIDLLLLEELNVSPTFSSWFFRRATTEETDAPSCDGAWHSLTHPQLGESDLVALYENGVAILLENKIDAPAQPDQAARYKKRGEDGCKEGFWQKFITCIVAPERYLQGNSEAQNYDASVSYEQIRDWFKSDKSRRSEYRAYIFDEAIDQNRRGYSPIADEDVTQFWLSYWNLANEQFPALEMRQPGIKPANSDWPEFRPLELGKDLVIVHKMAQGYVDLQVSGAAQKLDQISSILNDPSLEVAAAGKSGAVRIVIGAVDRFGSFKAQRSIVIRALEAANKLFLIAKNIRNDIIPECSDQNRRISSNGKNDE